MSGKKTKQARGKHVRKTPQGNRTPSKDKSRQRVSMQQLDNAFTALAQQQGMLEKRISGSIATLHRNDVELKSGLDASEFNLRAHQKALNALAIDVENMRRAIEYLFLKLSVTDLNFAFAAQETRMISVELTPSTEEQPASVVRRVEWAYYHNEVEQDLRLLAEEEKKARELEAAQKAEAKAKGEAEQPLPDKNPELPEGAAVFGG